jgi:hypothetical protein
VDNRENEPYPKSERPRPTHAKRRLGPGGWSGQSHVQSRFSRASCVLAARDFVADGAHQPETAKKPVISPVLRAIALGDGWSVLSPLGQPGRRAGDHYRSDRGTIGLPDAVVSGEIASVLRDDRPRALPPQPGRDRAVYLATVWPTAVARLGEAVATSGEGDPSTQRDVPKVHRSRPPTQQTAIRRVVFAVTT